MAALDHERTRRDQRRHLGVVEREPESKLRHFVLAGEHVTGRKINRHVLSDPVIEVAGADRQGVTLQHRRHAHGCLPAVGQAIKSDPPGIDKRKTRQPLQNALVLRDDD